MSLDFDQTGLPEDAVQLKGKTTHPVNNSHTTAYTTCLVYLL